MNCSKKLGPISQHLPHRLGTPLRKYQDHLFDDCGWWLVVGGWACAVCGGVVCHSAAIIYFLLECNQWPGTVKRGDDGARGRCISLGLHCIQELQCKKNNMQVLLQVLVGLSHYCIIKKILQAIAHKHTTTLGLFATLVKNR